MFSPLSSGRFTRANKKCQFKASNSPSSYNIFFFELSFQANTDLGLKNPISPKRPCGIRGREMVGSPDHLSSPNPARSFRQDRFFAPEVGFHLKRTHDHASRNGSRVFRPSGPKNNPPAAGSAKTVGPDGGLKVLRQKSPMGFPRQDLEKISKATMYRSGDIGRLEKTWPGRRSAEKRVSR